MKCLSSFGSCLDLSSAMSQYKGLASWLVIVNQHYHRMYQPQVWAEFHIMVGVVYFFAAWYALGYGQKPPPVQILGTPLSIIICNSCTALSPGNSQLVNWRDWGIPFFYVLITIHCPLPHSTCNPSLLSINCPRDSLWQYWTGREGEDEARNFSFQIKV